MHRRRYLAVLGAGVVGGVAGASRVLTGDDSDATESRPEADATAARPGSDRTATATPSDGPPSQSGEGPPGSTSDGPQVPTDVDLPVPESELNRAAPRDAIPAIVDPVFGSSWAHTDHEIATETYTDPSLSPDDRVIGLSREGITRAYPLKLLRRHEVVNDTLDTPLLVSYCPICDSGLVAHRRVEGDARTFGVSGFLFHANLVLYDQETESLWSQLLSQAIRGPETGTKLPLTVSTITTWGAWQAEHPDTTVLLPPPASNTVVGPVSLNYDLNPYEDHQTIAERYPEYGPLGDLEWSDTRLQRRTTVLGVAHDGVAVAYPKRDVRSDGPINDTVGGRPVVVASTPEGSLVAYDRRVAGETLSFDDGGQGTLVGGGSRWRPIDGAAVDGPHEGEQLPAVADAVQVFWAAWLKFHPETTVSE
jgi:hypothetical protein